VVSVVSPDAGNHPRSHSAHRHRGPALLDRTAQAAVDSDDAWLDAVCKEALRVRPVIFEFARKLTAPIQLGGCHIPAGVILAPSINLVQHSSRHYLDPEVFRPQRFLDERADPAVWLPSAVGCGAALALPSRRSRCAPCSAKSYAGWSCPPPPRRTSR
jgi:cytochrome P450